MASTANFFLMPLLVLLVISQQAILVKSEDVGGKLPKFLLNSDRVFLSQGDGLVLNSPPLPPKKSPPYDDIPSSTPYDGIPPKTSPHHGIDEQLPNSSPGILSYTPYAGIETPRKPPHLSIATYTPYSGIPPKTSPNRGIDGQVPDLPPLPPNKLPHPGIYTVNDKYIQGGYNKLVRKFGFKTPNKVRTTSSPVPKKSPHSSIASYTPYPENDKHFQGGDHTLVPKYGIETPNQGKTNSALIPIKPPHLSFPSYTPKANSGKYVPSGDDAHEPDPGFETSFPSTISSVSAADHP